MEQGVFAHLEGEWIGSGPFIFGPFPAGEATEYVRIEATDIATAYSYVRRSRITANGAPARIHNETGFIRTKSIGLMLSKGTWNILEWQDATGDYRQVAASPDTQDMQRKITVVSPSELLWENFMRVHTSGGQWFDHSVVTRFHSINRV